MDFQEYLETLVGKCEKDRLIKALEQKKTIVVSGPERSGKTTLALVLRSRGYVAVEDFDVHEIRLSEPLNRMIPDVKRTII